MAVCTFGPFTLELETGELRRDGRPVKLHPQPAAVLRLLVQRPGVVVSRDEIQKELWPDDTHVDFDLGINSCIKQIRTALDDEAERPRYIETIPRQGYRFVAAIDAPQETVERQKTFLHPRVWAVLTLLALGIGAAALMTFSPTLEEPSSPEVRPLTGYVGSEIDPALSPDGYQVAYAAKGDEEERFHIYVHLIDGDEPLQLTHADADDYTPVWSPDGTRIAFLRERSGELTHEILIVPALGGREQSLGTILARRETGPLWEPGLDWSPDGRFLATVNRTSPDEPLGVTLVSVDTGERRPLTLPPDDGTRDNHPRFSPDGGQVAFIRQRNRGGGHSVGWVPFDGDEPETLSVTSGLVLDLAWSQEESILFVEFEYGQRWGIWKYELGSSAPSRLSFGENARSISVSGNRLVYDEAVRENCDIWRMDGPTSNEKRPPEPLIVSTRMELAPRYSPDGKQIAVGSLLSGRSSIRICNSDGRDCYQPTEIQGGMQWSPDGKRLLVRGRLGNREPGLYITDVETNTTHRLTDRKRAPQWSRDGRGSITRTPLRTTRRSGKFQPTAASQSKSHKTAAFSSPKKPTTDSSTTPNGVNRPRKSGTIFGESPSRAARSTPSSRDLYIEGRNCTMWRNHIVYRHWVDEDDIPDMAPGRRSVMDMMDLETGEVTRLHTFVPKDRFCFGTAVSPDGRSILYAPQVSSGGSDLVLVDNFQ